MKPSDVKLNVLADELFTSPAADPHPSAPPGDVDGPRVAIRLHVVSDVICPWCWVGKRKLEAAIKILVDAVDVRVAWKPFQLNPRMPKDGIDRREYRTRKLGSWEHSQALDARLVAVGRSEGLDFRFDRMARTPNTLDAHRLIWMAGRLGNQDAIVEALFRAYFAEGADIGKREELCTVAASAGIPAAFAERLLGSDEGLPEVLAEEQEYKAMGVEGVPTFVIGGSIAFAGAIAPEKMALALRRSTADVS